MEDNTHNSKENESIYFKIDRHDKKVVTLKNKSEDIIIQLRDHGFFNGIVEALNVIYIVENNYNNYKNCVRYFFLTFKDFCDAMNLDYNPSDWVELNTGLSGDTYIETLSE